MIWLLLLGVYPSALDLTVYPGQITEIPITLVGDAQARIEANGVLEIDKTTVVQRKQQLQVPVQISPYAKPGKYISYIYVYETSKKATIPASAVRVDATVQTVSSEHVKGSRISMRRYFPVAAATIGLLAIAAFLIFGISMKRS